MEDVFSFVPETEYLIVLVGLVELTGIVIETFHNGIMMHDGTRIPQDKILFFRKNLGTD